MTFVFPLLLGGLALAGIPILLHLILRQKPKTLPFPAFRFLVQKHRSNLRKLQLRHLLLLALRIFLIAALCFALARPKLFHENLNLTRDRPVAAVLIFDTGPTMDYRTSDKVSRLDEAKTRGKELLKELPEGSRFLVLDTADPGISERGDWLTSLSQVRQRIDELKIKPTSGSVQRAVELALRQLHNAARGDDATMRSLPRFLAVVSDRTVASWTGGDQRDLHEAADRLPATLEGVQQLRSSAAPLLELLKALRTKVPPPAGIDYPDQALAEAVQAIRDRAGELRRADLDNDDALHQLIVQSRRQARTVIAALTRLEPLPTPENQEHRGKTVAALHSLTQNLAGVRMLFLDVGIDQPVDVALLQLDMPRQYDGRIQQLFAADEKLVIRVLAKSFGREVGAVLEGFVNKEKFTTKQVDLRAGEPQTIPLEIDLAKLKLSPGAHTLAVKLASKDALESNNQVFAAFAIRQPKRVLVLADTRAKGDWFAYALQCVGYASEIKTTTDLADVSWNTYEAVYLCGLSQPPSTLWQAAQAYVARGGNLGIIPGGTEMAPAAYQSTEARALMPGTWKQAVQKDARSDGAMWDLTPEPIFQHPILRPFRRWRDDDSINLTKLKRWAHGYWLVETDNKQAAVLVRYDEKSKPPALVERLAVAGGKVIVFTTPLDAREPRWNNYLENEAPFVLALAMYVTRYLTGEDKGVNLNFQCGVEEPRLPLPLAPRFGVVTLQGAELIETLSIDPQAQEVRFKDAALPGLYEVRGHIALGQPGTEFGKFSVTLPPEKGELTRVPSAEVEATFGAGSVVTAERGVDLSELLKSQWNEPLELFPYLMVLLLFVLALENLLANKFYRRED